MIDLSYNDSDYEYVRGNGVDRMEIADDLRILVAACQLRRCAVCTDPIRITKQDNDYFGMISGTKVGWIEHIIPKTWLGEDGIFNLAYTCKACNMLKSNKITFWSIWQAFRLGRTIGDFNFWKEHEEFMGHYQRQGFANCLWPWWARDRKTGDPVLFGFDGKNFDMQESFRLEYAIFRRNAYVALKDAWWGKDMQAKSKFIGKHLVIPELNQPLKHAPRGKAVVIAPLLDQCERAPER